MFKKEDLQEQVEYYLGDQNLSQDEYFHGIISADQEGWLDIEHILKCNKVKKLGVKTEDIVESLKDSEAVEANAEKAQIRRKDNKALPKLNPRKTKRRDAKIEQKDNGDEEVKDGAPEKKKFLNETDFKNPHVLKFEVVGLDETEKPDWRTLEKKIIADFPTLKTLYARTDEKVGQLVVSSNNTDEAAFDILKASKHDIGGNDYQFSLAEGEDLKAFWDDHGSHYQMCTDTKLRRIKKERRLLK